VWLAVLGSVVLHAAETATNIAPESNPPSAPALSSRGWLTFGLDRIHWLRSEVMGNPLWQYLASLIYIVLAFYVAKLLDYLIQVQLRKWAARTRTRLDGLVLELLHGPVKIVVFVVLLHVGLRCLPGPSGKRASFQTASRSSSAARSPMWRSNLSIC
jgi:hypothetical protein